MASDDYRTCEACHRTWEAELVHEIQGRLFCRWCADQLPRCECCGERMHEPVNVIGNDLGVQVCSDACVERLVAECACRYCGRITDDTEFVEWQEGDDRRWMGALFVRGLPITRQRYRPPAQMGQATAEGGPAVCLATTVATDQPVFGLPLFFPRKECPAVIITVIPSTGPAGKVADVELVFPEVHGGADGLFAGLKLVGFAVWEGKNGSTARVTFPARTYRVNGERRSWALLRPVSEADAGEALKAALVYATEQAQGDAGFQRGEAFSVVV